MFKVGTNITIGQYVFDYCVDVEIETNIDTLTDTCKITIPRKLEWDGKEIALGDDPILRRKDKIIVNAGYDDSLKTIFIGYVRNIKAGVPVVLECENSMFLLKQSVITKSYKSATLRNVLQDIIPNNVQFKTVGDHDIQLGQFRITRASIAKVLEELNSTYGLSAYFRNIPLSNGNYEPILYVGLPYWIEYRKEETFSFGHNIIDHDLIYRRAEDVQLKATVINWNRNNTKDELEVGDKEGEQRTLHYYGLTKDQCIERAKVDLEKYKYTGYSGTFTTFGEPLVEKGDVANIVGNQYHPDGKYLIRAVKKNVGLSGYRQVITLDSIINDKAASTATSTK